MMKELLCFGDWISLLWLLMMLAEYCAPANTFILGKNQPLNEYSGGGLRELHVKQGQRVNISCDAKSAGASRVDGGVVWSLHLSRLSRSGCGPKDPVITLASLVHTDSPSTLDQFYTFVSGVPDWKLHVGGAELNENSMNLDTAHINLTISKAKLEDSGFYKCDATVGGKDIFNPFSSLISVVVSEKDPGATQYLHISLQNSWTVEDFDDSMISPKHNHRKYGESVDISCVPRLMRNIHSLPFTVSKVTVQFMAFWERGSKFRMIAEYLPIEGKYNTITPLPENWYVSKVGVGLSGRNGVTSDRVRVDIKIKRVTAKDTGIFRCLVAKEGMAGHFVGEAGLKVFEGPKLLPGICDPTQPEQVPIEWADEGDTDLKTEAMLIDALSQHIRDLPESNDAFCKVAIIIMAIALLSALFLICKNCYHLILCCFCPKKYAQL